MSDTSIWIHAGWVALRALWSGGVGRGETRRLHAPVRGLGQCVSAGCVTHPLSCQVLLALYPEMGISGTRRLPHLPSPQE